MKSTKFAEIVQPNPLLISASCGVSRTPKRPLRFRDERFDEEFEHNVLFYDVFFDQDQEAILLCGPPMWNLEFEVKFAEYCLGDDARVGPIKLREMDRCSVCRLQASSRGTTKLKVRMFDGETEVDVGKSYVDAFSGKRSVLTMSKGNRLEWIRDWAKFYVEVHGAESLVFFDNGSREYTSTQILEVLVDVPGLDVVAVVDWAYKYGPQTKDQRFWDSDFCQYGAWQTARLRFFADAASVLNVDVDELLLPEKGSSSIFEATERSKEGYIRFPGRWIESVSDNGVADSARRRHRDFMYFDRQQSSCESKWCVSPGKVPAGAQWKVHRVAGLGNETTDDFLMRHFKGINTGWKDERNVVRAVDPRRHELDKKLSRCMRSVFSD